MTFAELTVLAEVARSATEAAVRDTLANTDLNELVIEADARDHGRDAYAAVIDAGRGFIRPLYPIYEVD